MEKSKIEESAIFRFNGDFSHVASLDLGGSDGMIMNILTFITFWLLNHIQMCKNR